MTILTSTMSTVTTTQHNIKHRVKPNDAIYTPKALVKLHYDEISDFGIKGLILDPCAGDGAYKRVIIGRESGEYVFSSNEITQGKDFLKNTGTGNYDIIIGNLPFSLTEKFLIKSAELKPDIISYLMPIYALTAARTEMMEKKGYKLVKLKLFKWYVCMGMCCFATWIKTSKLHQYVDNENVELTYDRTVWYKIDVWAKKKAKQKAREEKKAKKEEEKRIKKLKALRKRVARGAAALGKKKHKKWWCESQEQFSGVRSHDIGRFHNKLCNEYFKWAYRTGGRKEGRNIWATRNVNTHPLMRFVANWVYEAYGIKK